MSCMSHYLNMKLTKRNRGFVDFFTTSRNVVFSLILLRVVLEFVYRNCLSPNYYYSGFTYEFLWPRYLGSWLLFAVSLFAVPKLIQKMRLSDIVIFLLYCMSFVPATVMFGFVPTPYIWLYSIYWGALLVTQRFLKHFKFSGLRIHLSDTVMATFGQVFVGTILFVWAHYSHFHIQVSLVDVYDIRGIARTFSMPTSTIYIFSISKTAIPCLCIWALSKKKYGLLLELIIVQYLSFCIDGSKSAIFSIVLALIAYRFLGKTLDWYKLIPFAFFLICLIGYFECGWAESSIVLSMFIRRVMFIPIRLDYCYYDFFQQSLHPYDFFQQSVLRRIGFVSQYTIPIPNLIGGLYMGSYSTSANNGLFSDAYSNFGILGLILMPIAICFILRIMEACAQGLHPAITVAVIIVTAMSLMSSAFFTALLTHGVIINCIILYFLPRKPSK